MKANKIIKYLFEAINQDDVKKKQALKKIIDKMKKKESKLIKKLSASLDEDEKSTLEAKLKVLQAQRKKGEEAIDAINDPQ